MSYRQMSACEHASADVTCRLRSYGIEDHILPQVESGEEALHHF